MNTITTICAVLAILGLTMAAAMGPPLQDGGVRSVTFEQWSRGHR